MTINLTNKKNQFFILALILIVQLLLYFFLFWPIDLDETIYGYFGQRILAGDLPYRDVFDHKVPGIFFIYALILRFFGNYFIFFRLTALFFSLLTTVLLFKIGKLIANPLTGFCIAAFHAVFINGFFIQGTTANTEIFINLFNIVALWLFLIVYKKENDKRPDCSINFKKNNFYIFLAGIFSGLSFMTKPVAIFNFFVLFIFLLFFKKSVLKKTIYLFSGFFIFPLIFSFYFLTKNYLKEYFDYAFLINFSYLDTERSIFLSPFNSLKNFLNNVLITAKIENGFLWISALAGSFYLLIKKRSLEGYLFITYLAFSIIGIATGGYHFLHYNIQLIPALSLLAGIFLAKTIKKINGVNSQEYSKIINFSFFLVFLFFFFIIPILQYKNKFIPLQKNGHQYDIESIIISQELQKKVKPDEYLFVWPRTPQIYFFSQRQSASRFIFYHAWAEKKLSIKNNIIIDLEKNPPAFIVLDPYLKVLPDYHFLALEAFIEKYYQPEKKLFSEKMNSNWQIFKRSD